VVLDGPDVTDALDEILNPVWHDDRLCPRVELFFSLRNDIADLLLQTALLRLVQDLALAQVVRRGKRIQLLSLAGNALLQGHDFHGIRIMIGEKLSKLALVVLNERLQRIIVFLPLLLELLDALVLLLAEIELVPLYTAMPASLLGKYRQSERCRRQCNDT